MSDSASSGSSVHGLLQARILEWIVRPSTRGSSQPSHQAQVSCIAGGFFYCLNHQGNPRRLEWVAYPFFRGTSWLRNQTGFSCIAGRFFISWATREAPFPSLWFNLISSLVQFLLLSKWVHTWSKGLTRCYEFCLWKSWVWVFCCCCLGGWFSLVTSHSSCLYIKKLQCQSPGEIAMIQATRMDSSQHLGIEAESLSSIQTSRMEEELKQAHQKGGGQWEC